MKRVLMENEKEGVSEMKWVFHEISWNHEISTSSFLSQHCVKSASFSSWSMRTWWIWLKSAEPRQTKTTSTNQSSIWCLTSVNMIWWEWIWHPWRSLLYYFLRSFKAGLLSNVNVKFSLGEIKKVMKQLLNGLYYIHSNKVCCSVDSLTQVWNIHYQLTASLDSSPRHESSECPNN